MGELHGLSDDAAKAFVRSRQGLRLMSLRSPAVALEASGHQGSRRLGDGAARAVEGDLGDTVAVQPEVDIALVPAGRVVPMGDPVGGRQAPAVPGAFVVVEDYLLIKVGEVGHGSSTVRVKAGKAKQGFLDPNQRRRSDILPRLGL